MIHTFHTFLSTPIHFKTDLRTHNSTTASPTAYFTVRRNQTSRYYGSFRVCGNRKWRNNNPTVVATTAMELESAAEVIRKFYGGINGRDLSTVEDLIAQNCIYEDLVFPRPFIGRKAIVEFFNKFIDSISTDLQFVIDDVSEEDTSAVGVTWHLGCSFYRLDVVNGQRQIVYGRDSVEPAIKPGETALVAIRGVTWLLQKFPFLVDRL